MLFSLCESWLERLNHWILVQKQLERGKDMWRVEKRGLEGWSITCVIQSVFTLTTTYKSKNPVSKRWWWWNERERERIFIVTTCHVCFCKRFISLCLPPFFAVFHKFFPLCGNNYDPFFQMPLILIPWHLSSSHFPFHFLHSFRLLSHPLLLHTLSASLTCQCLSLSLSKIQPFHLCQRGFFLLPELQLFFVDFWFERHQILFEKRHCWLLLGFTHPLIFPLLRNSRGWRKRWYQVILNFRTGKVRQGIVLFIFFESYPFFLVIN